MMAEDASAPGDDIEPDDRVNDLAGVLSLQIVADAVSWCETWQDLRKERMKGQAVLLMVRRVPGLTSTAHAYVYYRPDRKITVVVESNADQQNRAPAPIYLDCWYLSDEKGEDKVCVDREEAERFAEEWLKQFSELRLSGTLVPRAAQPAA